MCMFACVGCSVCACVCACEKEYTINVVQYPHLPTCLTGHHGYSGHLSSYATSIMHGPNKTSPYLYDLLRCTAQVCNCRTSPLQPTLKW